MSTIIRQISCDYTMLNYMSLCVYAPAFSYGCFIGVVRPVIVVTFTNGPHAS